MKFGQLIESNNKNTFLQNHASRSLFAFLKSVLQGKCKWSADQFQHILITFNLARQRAEYLENEKSFQGEIESVFHHF